MPHIFIPIPFFDEFFNVSLFVYSVLLTIIYRRYSKYIIKVFNLEKVEIQQRYAKEIINMFSAVIMMASIVLCIGVVNE